MLAKVAITVLVYRDTGSSLLSASAFALGYLPWGLGGPLLSAMADRLPWRRTLIGCDLARAALICLLAVPGVPLPVLLLLLLSSSLLAPPFEAARSALLPEVLPGDRYFVAASLTVVSGYVANVAGFVGGGALVALISARGALLTDAATFAVSAALIALFVRRRPPPEPARTGSLTRDTADGIRLVFGHRVLRSYVLLVWVVSSFVFAGEGLAAPYAAHLGGGPATVGLLLAAIPLGVAIGGLVVTRFTQPSRRAGLVLPLAAVSTLALSPLIFDPPLIVVLTLYVISGAGLACAVPLNAMFVRSVASTFRGRAFGVARTGLEIGQGLAILVAGVLAVVLPVSLVIALLAGVSGTLGVLLLGLRWPSSGAQNDAQEHPISGVGIPARHSATLRTPDRMR
jgi:MFS family permease